jgi:hypothetical protein
MSICRTRPKQRVRILVQDRFGSIGVKFSSRKAAMSTRNLRSQPTFYAQERVMQVALGATERGKPQPGEVKLYLPYALLA